MSEKKLYEMTREELRGYLIPRLIALSGLSAGLGVISTLTVFLLIGVWNP